MAKNNDGGSNIRAYEYIYQSILSNKILLGDPISENNIAQEMKISRSPVREALKKLESEGIVTHYPNRGMFVTPITVQDLEEIFDLRILFELYALETSYARIGDKVLEDIAHTIESLGKNSSPAQYHSANSRLHSIIIACCGNRRLQNFYDNLNAQIAIITRISARSPEHFASSKKEHLDITKTIIARDLKKAKRLLNEHLERVRRDTIAIHRYESR